MTRLAFNRTRLTYLFQVGLSLGLMASSAIAFAQEESVAERYARILADADGLTAYNEQLSRQLESQDAQVALIEQQILDMDATNEQIGPMVQKLYDALKSFVASDLPFIDPTGAGPDSRSERIAKISDLMEDEEISNGERYRRLMEAYQIELDYGRNMVTYAAKLEDGRDADFVRVGRVSLMYRTLDGEEAGYWDKNQNKWVVDNDYKKVIGDAILIARKELAPDLVTLPVPAPEEVRM